MDYFEGEDESENTPSPRVNLDLTPQARAHILDSQLGEVRMKLSKIPLANDVNSTPRRAVESLILDSQSLLEGIKHNKLTKGSSRIASNLLRAVELLEKAGRIFDEPIRDLLDVVVRASQHGLTIDDYTLSDNKHAVRVKS